ncbi:MAG: enoyl-CoA hydratase/isomerase family protein [Acidimicrobiia bacterium]
MLRYEVGPDQVGRITLDRPEAKNALTIEMRDGIVDAVRSARQDSDVRALLITGTGDAFCAGMDLSASTVTKAAERTASTMPSRISIVSAFFASGRSSVMRPT